MNFHYVNPKAVESIIGHYAPVSSMMLARIIEETLFNTNLGFVQTEAGVGRSLSQNPEISAALVGIADKLLHHNTSNSRQNKWDFYSGLDFDLVHESNFKNMSNGKGVNTSVKAYFFYTEFGRPPQERRVVFHLNHNEINGTQWSISFPIQLVMKGFPWMNGGYFGYCHGITLSGEDGNCQHQRNYIGITKRNWLIRMSEHFREIQSGSNRLFHSAWRQYIGNSNVHLTSELVVANHSFDEIMSWEEWAVDSQMALGTSLNMIPGGFKGMKFLHEHRITQSDIISLEERDEATQRFQALNPRAGIPNLLVSRLWNNADYAESVICGAEGRLSVEQVRRIRDLQRKGIPAEEILKIVNARNILQVERVLSGITYSRIK